MTERPVLIAVLLIAVTLISGCGTSRTPAPVDSGSATGTGPVRAGSYRVREGDTLYSIAWRHKLDYRRVARWNGIDSSYRIYPGKLIRLSPPGHAAAPVTKSKRSKATETTASSSGKSSPGGSRANKTSQKTTAASETAKTSKSASTRGSAGKVGRATRSGVRWRWPLPGKLTQTYRQGDRTRQGIRISGSAGQMVKAAGSGSVVYSGSGLKGYGNLIIVKHNKSYLSAYGFNRRLLVKEGDRVNGGQNLAEVGLAANGAHILHFEIRRNGTAVDPLRYLPRLR